VVNSLIQYDGMPEKTARQSQSIMVTVTFVVPVKAHKRLPLSCLPHILLHLFFLSVTRFVQSLCIHICIIHAMSDTLNFKFYTD